MKFDILTLINLIGIGTVCAALSPAAMSMDVAQKALSTFFAGSLAYTTYQNKENFTTVEDAVPGFVKTIKADLGKQIDLFADYLKQNTSAIARNVTGEVANLPVFTNKLNDDIAAIKKDGSNSMNKINKMFAVLTGKQYVTEKGFINHFQTQRKADSTLATLAVEGTKLYNYLFSTVMLTSLTNGILKVTAPTAINETNSEALMNLFTGYTSLEESAKASAKAKIIGIISPMLSKMQVQVPLNTLGLSIPTIDAVKSTLNQAVDEASTIATKAVQSAQSEINNRVNSVEDKFNAVVDTVVPDMRAKTEAVADKSAKEEKMVTYKPDGEGKIVPSKMFYYMTTYPNVVMALAGLAGLLALISVCLNYYESLSLPEAVEAISEVSTEIVEKATETAAAMQSTTSTQTMYRTYIAVGVLSSLLLLAIMAYIYRANLGLTGFFESIGLGAY